MGEKLLFVRRGRFEFCHPNKKEREVRSVKRIFALILILIMLLSCGCAVEELPEGSQLGAYSGEEEKDTISLPARESITMIYYPDMDTHPLTTTNSENHELLKLVYSPLVRVAGSMTAEYVLAESVTNKDRTVTVKLKKDLLFSDKSKVQAEDVTAGFRLIRKDKNSPYYDRLANVEDYWAEDSRTVKIRLKEPDVDFINYLDIPVVKREKAVGCGPYRFSDLNGKTVLVPNKYYFEAPKIKVIELCSPANEKERQNMFTLGLLDVYFMPTESELTFSGGKDYRVQTYSGDHFLYLGINGANGYLKNAAFRRYFSGILDREKLVKDVLLGQADATAYPFQPTWYKAAGLAHSADWTDPEKKQLAKELGLTLSGNQLSDQKGKQVTLSLLVNKSSDVHPALAAAIADNLSVSGIKIKLVKAGKEEYLNRLKEGKYALYLGEVKTGRTLNTAVYRAGSPLCYSSPAAPKTEAAAAAYTAGKKTLSAFAESFGKEMPVIPLAYRQGVLLVSSDISDFKSTGTWSVYGDICKIKTLETEVPS